MGNFSASFPTPSRQTMMSGMCATISRGFDVAPILSTSFVSSVSAPGEEEEEETLVNQQALSELEW